MRRHATRSGSSPYGPPARGAFATIRNWITSLASLILAAACTAAPVPSSSARPSPPPPPTPVATSPGPAMTPVPRAQTFGPIYDEKVPPGPLVPIGDHGGALLSQDRLEISVAFLGGAPYTRENWCLTDYVGWAAISGGQLLLAIETVHHPEQAAPPSNGGCTLMGYGYLFRLLLPERFVGSAVVDRASGRAIWVPPPETVAEIKGLPAGWALIDVSSTKGAGPGVHELNRTYAPSPGTGTDKNDYISLIQVFGGPADRAIGNVVGSAVIDGNEVPVGANGDAGFAISWTHSGDGFALYANGHDITLDQVIAMATSVGISAP